MQLCRLLCLVLSHLLSAFLLLSGLPELKKVVVVSYVKSAGEDGFIGSIKNGLVRVSLHLVHLAFRVTFISGICLLTAETHMRCTDVLYHL